ncbi:hypothetical protein [Rheinheimera sp.]|uniref:hypothetical protein n=1 Tax=Rheinheimera sp. TaxID=1869214 RepID=UPI00273307EB|nr:hypothetical protein [Rheinheimera sp.]MDP2714235.1 hypothetical protein [Rheinheimera sp.]
MTIYAFLALAAAMCTVGVTIGRAEAGGVAEPSERMRLPLISLGFSAGLLSLLTGLARKRLT